jgi:putative membrane protein
MKYLKVLFWLVAFVFTIHFSMQNRDEVTLRYSFGLIHGFQREITQVPLFLVILCSVFFGLIVGGLGDLYARFRLKRALRQSRKEIERLEKEIQTLQIHDIDPPSAGKRDL